MGTSCLFGIDIYLWHRMWKDTLIFTCWLRMWEALNVGGYFDIYLLALNV